MDRMFEVCLLSIGAVFLLEAIVHLLLLWLMLREETAKKESGE